MAKKTFESALKQLESIVKEMESGDLTLEKAVKKYEDGIANTRFCLDILDKTEQKITQLTMDSDGKPNVSDFKEDQ
ncbi:exodeoxyribonuclease VII small subunit [Desulfobacter hydrogenophilus]|uniref:Exodeoxyribonuclease 7 small subunit n=1 Tax=Desulfobacter hydrogenophilus TaxID=2291 RepID=A0A328FCZ6_9BACT|nr:exodeoxyribonuclease VII small subunit [Desulfobacter hydrogenophilus]NDY73059.1 exodeoxyribonuclease VII small subunit [Desulfobacter hydrogenophilus]QBH14691.1 exodeoxyribonuclease VII small subunit [Desulfobacter hydrogenophilus]RAM00907.1 exodeoxyribonuclease VII small subunit [Desulfobacter hydrogenophilus]